MKVSALALGGYNLGLVKTRREAIRIVAEAIDVGKHLMARPDVSSMVSRR